MPESAEYLWLEYLEIKKGCEKVDYSELRFYQSITGCMLTPWEASIMVDIDIIRRRHG